MHGDDEGVVGPREGAALVADFESKTRETKKASLNTIPIIKNRVDFFLLTLQNTEIYGVQIH